MTNDTQSQLAANKQALLKIRELKQQIADLQQQQTAVSEPIAIVSMACRFPKTSNTPEAFWQSLMDQADEVSEIPDDRWDLPAFHDDDPEVPGKMYARHGVFLDQIDQMDPEFFGISPREATWVDPQQRLLMEVGWEALERAGWTPEAIGEHTGIFVGWMHNDYQNEASDSFLNLNPYIATGAAGSFLCGRLAYYLGLQGPSVAVDTACSSSLVALHLACQSLQQRDCDRALVGGVNAICSPTTNILTCKLKALSVTGQSRAFDAAADGYLRGEGCGVVTLRRLADAERDGDPVLAVISGSAIGHNGFSSGLTAPNPKAQEKVIRQAVERAQLTPSDVSYLEAHGTGTELGDPIEMRAAASALASDRDTDQPLLVGSVKTNIGHLEAAAGMAGLIKVLLSIQNDCLPGQLNFETPNPHIPWDTSPVKVLTEATAWPNAGQKIAGVSAFGMSGTNAHVVISEHTKAKSEPDAKPAVEGPSQLITLSGKTEQAVAELADRYQQYLKNNSATRLQDFSFTTNCRRSHFEHRSAVVAADSLSAIDGLRAISKGASSDFVVNGQGRRSPKIAWQFTGQGSQYVGMAKGLYDTEPVFAAAIDRCEAWLSEWRSESLMSVLFDDEGLGEDAKIHHTSWTQPAIFAVQMGLAKLLASLGLQPDVVWGHSVGQYAAACVAGMMSWQDGLKLIAERGRLIGELPEGGLMLAVFAALPDVEGVLKESEVGDAVSIAALNGTHLVLSGDSASIAKLEQAFVDRSLRCKVLTTSHAFHSSLMDPALQPFAAFASKINFQAGQLPLICNVTGKVLAADAVLDADYWASHIREAVRFSDCIDTAVEIGCEVVLELGPQGVLTRMAAANWTKPGDRLVSCIHKDADDGRSFLKAVGQLYAFGATPNFGALHEGEHCEQILLPTYPFQRRRFWGPDKPRAAHAEHHTAHPLLGSELKTPDAATTKRYETFVDADSPSWVVDHQVMDQVVMPGAGYLELALAAGKENSVHDILFAQPLQPSDRTSLQTIVNRPSGEDPTIESFSLAADQKTWTSHFSAKLSSVVDRPDDRDLSAIRQSCVREISAADFYSSMVDLGLQYGPAFQVIQSMHLSDDSVLSKLVVQGDVRGYLVAPPLLDGALHSLAAMLLKDSQQDLFLPVGIERLVLHGDISAEMMADGIWCHASWGQSEEGQGADERSNAASSGDIRYADLELLDNAGSVLLSISQLKVKKLDRAAMRRMSGGGTQRLIYGLKHEPYSLPGQPVSNTNWLLVSDAGDPAASQMQQLLMDGGQQVVCCTIDDASDCMTKALANDQSFDGIAWLPSDETQPNCTGLLKLIQTLKQKEVATVPCGIAIVTKNGSHANLQSPNPLQTQYHGFARVLGAEHPEYRCRLIDFSTADDTGVQRVADLLQVEAEENEFVVGSDDVVVARLARVRSKQAVDVFDDWGGRSVLITGGLGSLGQAAARWLASKGVSHVVLVSRRQPDEETAEQLKQMETLGCQVVVHSADVTSQEQMAGLVREFGNRYPELGGVIHAAGVLDDGRIVDQTWARFAAVIATKIQGAKILDELTAALPLRFFVLYSSASSVFGTPGQSNYATGNAFLDGLAYQRNLNGQVGTSINWGPWDTGMAASDQLRKRLALQGIRPLAIDEAHAAMEQILEQDLVQATVIDADWRRMQMGLGGEAPPLLSELAPARSASQMADSAFVVQLKRLRGSAQTELLVKTVQDLLQTTLATTDAPDTDRPLIEMGLDSLMAVEFSTELQMILGEQIPIGPTMLFDHPTIDAIAAHVLEMVAAEDDVKESTSAASPVESAADAKMTERESIAIVGMSCRFPGAADLGEFWDNILDGVDSVCEIPSDRWDIDRFYDENRAPGKMYTKQGGFLDDIGDFEPGFFNISDQEACWIDPQHRMLLENSYRALEHAGISSAPLADPNVGVFMGIMGQDYAFLPKLDDEEVIQGFQGAGLSHSAGVGRISYVFGFEGPSVAVDTASSSSLVALFQAVRSLQDRNCNMALAGGVNAILAPVNSLLMSKAGLLSADGRCKSFSAEADGFGRGEGCGVVVLKRLSDAERDGDNVLAVVRGAAVVHNGFTSGITTPSGKSQARVITEALQDAGIAASQVQYLEAHGTGTELGDPMELGAAAAVYGKGRKKNQPLLVGSVKGNISHLEAAGGVSGLIKTVLSLHHGIIPPQANFDSPSTHIPWKRIPVKMVTETTQWPEADERFAGVTALGLVGTNAHVVLSGGNSVQATVSNLTVSDLAAASDLPASDSAASDPPAIGGELADKADSEVGSDQAVQLLVLSARDPERLKEVAKSYLDVVNSANDVDFADFCHSAAIGRRHYEYRAAFPVNRLNQLADGLSMVAEGKSSAEINSSKSQPKLAWNFTSFAAESAPEIRQSIQQVYATEPVFRQFVSDLDQRLAVDAELTRRPVVEFAAWIEGELASGNVEELHLFVLQAGLVHVWRSWGIEPDVVLGTGVGQYTAACVAGGLCFFDSAALILRRQEALAALAESVEGTASGNTESDNTAADSAVVSGEAAVAEFEAFADTLNFYPPNMPLICSLNAEVVAVHRTLGGSYWRQHLTDSPSSDIWNCVASLNCDVIQQLGADLADHPSEDVTWDEKRPALLPTTSQKMNILTAMKHALGQLYVAGLNPDFKTMNGHQVRKRISLPHYPFHKKRYWITELSEHVARTTE